ncbi:Dolichol-phosphate mannosyltransferase [Nitrosotalea sinensis]|jgi:dolichol-phosphate mannosyltransferase|uniref:Dolichol-phosphate mannosyltransferase n=1 Tax=Nitrosotalea sinensis TaxID=1499975 RepID=A0A2H1EJ35_9ARCH|nr:glycosyltransferase family 2 protein [Candidatus Nitrosotalea sinensis]SHO48075.1 Dolichol-phosphate mannosyltransferase [Candidatus Nitrosotalea sinensis]
MNSIQKEIRSKTKSLSIVIPTYNESKNIVKILDSLRVALTRDMNAEVIVVDDNSPDGTSKTVEEYANSKNPEYPIHIVRRENKRGLSSAIVTGIEHAKGDAVVVMDSDMSHPPQTIPKMVEELQNPDCDIVVASRYVEGGSVSGWPFKRKLISKGATKIAQHGLGIKIKDPMSGFFAFKKHIVNNIKFDAIGYKVLLEILVKAKDAKVKEIPYNFIDRTTGKSKLDLAVSVAYLQSVWKLYRYGKSVKTNERRASVHFLSKAGRFYTVGASGLLVNYIVSFLFGAVLSNLWYLYATMIGIVFSMSTNFILNKVWTFEDRTFEPKKTLIQYGLFLGFSGIGAVFQLLMVYGLVELRHVNYSIALFLAVAVASVGNFLLNKKWTFQEKVWS